MKRFLNESGSLLYVSSIVLLLIGTNVFSWFSAGATPCRIELAENWKLISSKEVQSEDSAVSAADYREDRWHPIRRMPATVLQILQEDDVYPNLYVGQNLLNVPQDLYKQDWWYRTTFTAPAGECYTLEETKTRWVKLEGYNTAAV